MTADNTQHQPPQPAHLPSSGDAAIDLKDIGSAAKTNQPSPHMAMDPQRPHPPSDEEEPRLRGGDGGETCPGRFCFIIPCPLPCNFCVFPCPC